MKEDEFVEKLKSLLDNDLKKKYELKDKINLIYKIIINDKYEVDPDSNEIKNPKRGHYSFQTDLVIMNKKNKIPLVVMEIKVNSLSTHDILIYSTKAQKHKEIYPYLRYGLVVNNIDKLTNKFFTHNQGFDFAIVFSEKNKNKLVDIIKTQIKSAEKLLDVLKNKNNTEYFNTIIKIG